jgi:hypothetical protein
MAFSFLQDNGGLFGPADLSDQSLPSSDSGSGIIDAFKNIGLNLASGAATVGVGYLANQAGVSPAQFAATGGSLAYNSSLLTARPGTRTPLGAALGVSPNVLVIGGALVLGLIAFAVFRK